MAKDFDLDKLDAFNVFTQFNSMLNSGEDVNLVSEFMFELCVKKNRSLNGLMFVKIHDGWTFTHAKGFDKTEFTASKIQDDLLMTPELKAFLAKKNLRFSYDIKFGDLLLGKIFIDRQDIVNLKDKKLVSTILSYGAIYIYQKNLEIDIKKSKVKVENHTEKQSVLFDLSKEFNGLMDIELIKKLIVYSINNQFFVSKFAIVVFTEDDILVMESKYKKDIAELLKNYKYRDIEFTLTKKDIDRRYKLLAEEDTEVIIPLQHKDEVIGLLLLGQQRSEEDYTKHDIEYLEGLASLATISIENVYKIKDLVEKQKIDQENEIIRNIHKSMLPQELPKIKNGDIEGDHLPSGKVGGDYYNATMVDENNVFFVIATISDGGLQSQLLVKSFKAYMDLIPKLNIPLDVAINGVSDLVSENLTNGTTLSLFCAYYNTIKKDITYVNAGINTAYLMRSKKLRYLTAGGPAFSTTKPETPYQPETLKLRKTDMLMFFTNEINNLTGSRGEKYVPVKLEEVSMKNALKPARHLLNIIIKSIDEFSKGVEQSNDISFMNLKVK